MGLHNFGTAALVMLLAPAGFAVTHYVPHTCAINELHLVAINVTAQDQTFWTQEHEGREVNESGFDVAAEAKIFLNGTDFLKNSAVFTLSERAPALRFQLQCGGDVYDLPTLASSAFALPARALHRVDLRIQNLHHSAQRVRVIVEDAKGAALQENILALDNSYVTGMLKLNVPANAAQIRVRGEQRLAVVALDRTAGEPITAVAVNEVVDVDPATAYFLIGNESLGESYVLPLKDIELIAEARALATTRSKKIVFALAEPAPALSENRNVLSGGEPWSWKITNVSGFDDIGGQFCSGSARYLEDFKETWMPEPRPICFWNFHILKELSPLEVAQGRLQKPMRNEAP